jgi:hypothetical protein
MPTEKPKTKKRKKSTTRKNRSRESEIRDKISSLITNPDSKIFWTVERRYAKQIIDETSVDFFLSIDSPTYFTLSSLRYYVARIPKYKREFEISKFEQEKPESIEYSDTNFLDDEESFHIKPKTEVEFLKEKDEEE